MEESTTHGLTILFVSHNMAAINRLCSRAMLLEEGRLTAEGTPEEVTSRYLAQNAATVAEWRCSEEHPAPGKRARVLRVRVVDGTGNPRETHPIDAEIRVEVDYECLAPRTVAHVQLQVLGATGDPLFTTSDHLVKGPGNLAGEPGRYRSVCTLPPNLLSEGRHWLSVLLMDTRIPEKYDVHRSVASFWVQERGDGRTARGMCPGDWPGVVRPLLAWSVERCGGGHGAT
jgi:lipopolysaccharide transport system ATP-binding protein